MFDHSLYGWTLSGKCPMTNHYFEHCEDVLEVLGSRDLDNKFTIHATKVFEFCNISHAFA